MTFEQLQILKSAQSVILNLAVTYGGKLSELPKCYNDAYVELSKIVNRYEEEQK